MMALHRYRTSLVIAVFCLVLALRPAFASGVSPGADPSPAASTAGAAAVIQANALDDLPAGLSGALASSLAGKLPRDYHFTPADTGFQVKNTAQSLAFAFTTQGVQVRDSAGTWTWGLALTAAGRGEQIAPVPEAELVADGARLEYRRGCPSTGSECALTEWYLNSAWGLEQGFTLSSPPSGLGRMDRGNLILQLALSGDLQAELENDNTLLLRDASGKAVIRYAGLHAYDAAGLGLPAKLLLAPDGALLSIVVDDSGAAYPITVDPWIQVAQFTGEEAGEDRLGTSVAIDGDTIVAGAPHDDDNGHETGAVYVFSGAGGWTGTINEVAKLAPADPTASGTGFGFSVAISGDTIVVGSSWSQAAYVFEKPAGGWAAATGEVAKLTTSDPEGFLGNSVAINGDTIVVGGPRAKIGANNYQGAAYIYVRTGPSWAGTLTETARLTASDGEASDQLGASVALSGDTVVAGASRADVGGSYGRGAAYVYVKPSAGSWTSTSTFDAKLTASDGIGGDYFGGSVAISGDTIVAGAHGAEVGVNYYQGAAYLFEKPVAGWAGSLTESAKLTASDGVEMDMFGGTVAISGDTVIAAAPESTVGGSPRRGKAYVFVKPAGGWASTSTFDAKLSASDGAAHDTFGQCLAVDGDTVVAGAPGYRSDQGTAYVYVKPGPGWSGTPMEAAKLIASDGGAGDAFGTAMALEAGTLVVGAPEAVVAGKPAQGTVYVYVKPPGGWASAGGYVAKLTASDGAEYDRFGSSVAISGDTIVAGAPEADVGVNEFQGAAYVFEKPPGGWAGPQTEAAKLVASDGFEWQVFGRSVAIRGDNAVAGAPAGPGAAYVFERPGATWTGSLVEVAKLTASDFGGQLGASVAIGDAYIATGAPSAQVVSGNHTGAVYIFGRPGPAWSGTNTEDARLIALEPCGFCSLGTSVAVSGQTVFAGDMDAPKSGGIYSGGVYVFTRPASGWAGIVAPTAALSPDDAWWGDKIGTSVAVDGNTVVAGAPYTGIGDNTWQGAVYVFEKPPAGWAEATGHSTRLLATDGGYADQFGASVAISGATVATGAPYYRSKQGAAYLFEVEPGSIIIKKETEPGGGKGFEFSQDIDGSGSFTLDDGASQTFLEVGPGQYTVTEGDPGDEPGGYVLTDLVCEDGNPSGEASSTDLEGRTATINLDRGETVTCTFTNTRWGTIFVEKQTYPGGDPGPFAFQGAVTGSLGDGGQLKRKVLPGTYTVEEVVPGGWDLTSVECDDSNSRGEAAQSRAVFKVAPGEKVTCTFTNSRQGTVTIVKEALPQSPQAFDFAGDLGSFSLTDDGQSYNARTFKNLQPGRYAVRETVPDGWHLGALRCADQDGGTLVHLEAAQAAIDLDEGEAVVCTFTNTRWYYQYLPLVSRR